MQCQPAKYEAGPCAVRARIARRPQGGHHCTAPERHRSRFGRTTPLLAGGILTEDAFAVLREIRDQRQPSNERLRPWAML